MDLISPMLAESASETDLINFCNDDRFAAEQKVDGNRLLMHVGDGFLFPASRSGKELLVPRVVRDAFDMFVCSPGQWIFDGEYLDRVYYIFDLIHSANGWVNTDTPFRERRDVLEIFWSRIHMPPHVRLLPSYRDTLDKLELAQAMKAGGCEGVIFRRLNAPYSQKRTRDLVKVKFTNDIDCVVVDASRDGKANLVLGLYDSHNLIEVAECTALSGDKDRIQVGDVVTVRYLYASPDRRLVQPTLPRIRTDKAPTECTMHQLQYTNRTVNT